MITYFRWYSLTLSAIMLLAAVLIGWKMRGQIMTWAGYPPLKNGVRHYGHVASVDIPETLCTLHAPADGFFIEHVEVSRSKHWSDAIVPRLSFGTIQDHSYVLFAAPLRLITQVPFDEIGFPGDAPDGRSEVNVIWPMPETQDRHHRLFVSPTNGLFILMTGYTEGVKSTDPATLVRRKR